MKKKKSVNNKKCDEINENPNHEQQKQAHNHESSNQQLQPTTTNTAVDVRPFFPSSPSPLSFTSQPCFGTPCPPSRGLARLLGEMAEAGVGRGAGAITHLVVVVVVTAAVAAEGRGGNNMAHRRHPPSRTRWDT